MSTVNIRYLTWAFGYWVRRQILRQKIPFIGGLVINERCNLHCRQCRVSNRSIPDAGFEQILDALRTFRDCGIRSVFIEGGEPFLWRDGDHRLEDVVQAARNMGFYVVSIYTNGTLSVESSADTVFISLDGLQATNDSLRGPVFDRVLTNVAASKHPNLLVNYTINALNCQDVPGFCHLVRETPNLRGVFFYFHTPYYGFDEMFLDADQRRRVVEELLDLQRQGLPILNSTSALKAAASGRWRRPSDLCRVWANGKLYTCCRALGNDEVCENCGYLGYTEIVQILKLHPSAIRAALKYIPARRTRA